MADKEVIDFLEERLQKARNKLQQLEVELSAVTDMRDDARRELLWTSTLLKEAGGDADKTARVGEHFALVLRSSYYSQGFFNVPARFQGTVAPGPGVLSVILRQQSRMQRLSWSVCRGRP